MHSNDLFYLNSEEPNKSCLLALRDIILKQNRFITETLKYGMPCFCYKSKPFCYLWIDKKQNQPYILMVEGKQLTNKYLEEGTRKRMKILRIDSHKDIPIGILNEVLKEALLLYKNDEKG